jgi:hypothetical protein
MNGVPLSLIDLAVVAVVGVVGAAATAAVADDDGRLRFNVRHELRARGLPAPALPPTLLLRSIVCRELRVCCWLRSGTQRHQTNRIELLRRQQR